MYPEEKLDGVIEEAVSNGSTWDNRQRCTSRVVCVMRIFAVRRREIWESIIIETSSIQLHVIPVIRILTMVLVEIFKTIVNQDFLVPPWKMYQSDLVRNVCLPSLIIVISYIHFFGNCAGKT